MIEQELLRQVRGAVDRLASALAAGKSDQLRAYLSAMGRFHRYSLGNTFLIQVQCPHASRVAGFQTWRRMGRFVRKGERAIRLLAPVVYRNRNTDDEEEQIAGFRSVCVFDISQTDGAALPSMGETGGEPGRMLEALRVAIAKRGIEIERFDGGLAVQGWSTGARIGLCNGLSPAEEFSTLAHEFGHALLHRDGTKYRVEELETEAEAVAYVVCEGVGLKTGTAASDYIQLHGGDRDTLLKSLNRVQRTAASILTDLIDLSAGAPLPARRRRLAA